MELNRDQIAKALECHTKGRCYDCPIGKEDIAQLNKPCSKMIAELALSLYRELTREKEKLIEERDTFREYAYNMQKYVENIKHKEEVGYEPSAARYAAEMDMWRVIALEKKELTEEIERVKAKQTGHWYIREYEYFTCSECGEDYYNGCECTEQAKEQLADGKHPNYCPNCGAEMKG